MSARQIFVIKENARISRDVFRMRLSGEHAITAPGQFVNIALDGFFLRRPISVFDADEKGFTILYKTVGGGTSAMSGYPKGKEIDALTGLGNGFDVSSSGEKPLLVGGGVGAPPLYMLAKKLIERGKSPSAILGFSGASDIICKKELESLGVPVTVTTVDGSFGMKCFVTDALLQIDFDYFYACGPEAMLKALSKSTEKDGQLSFEARMACGFGACMGCTCRTKYGSKRICVDGPVLRKEEVVW